MIVYVAPLVKTPVGSLTVIMLLLPGGGGDMFKLTPFGSSGSVLQENSQTRYGGAVNGDSAGPPITSNENPPVCAITIVDG